MPHFTLSVGPGGPVIDAFVYVSPERHQVLEKLGQKVPDGVQIRALIDTGASCTCVDKTVITALGIDPKGRIPVHTPSTEANKPHLTNQYDVNIIIPSRGGPFVSGTIPVVEEELEHQGIKALIGRDILSRCVLIFQGGFFTLTF